ncbi:MAG: imidazole glycerol phosphate synthase subunit HisH [Nitrososphaeria archaeon]
MNVAIVDYGASNLFSLRAAFERLGSNVTIINNNFANNPDLLVMPGVGSFGQAASSIEPIRKDIVDYINDGGTFLGICLGLHLIFDSSEEGSGKGLGLIHGNVKRIRFGKVPHMGWSETKLVSGSSLWDGLKGIEYFYYAHSYMPEYTGSWTKAVAEYGEIIPAFIEVDNIIGVQFHPEKSGNSGQKFLKNVLRMVKG